ncbi:hypothetical protein GDO86_000818 [Hymenochirus boettgeri]|uniref:Uncharacterized protein n=1 Tax=Hymenochirus boettgeri TaxID=247094 RepID=A0A8T2KA01_9PIPI|nr:hypothetical protein GDO86_000818 [Hymenochirus boettgeri]
MSQKGPVGDGLSRLKNVYRSRYVFDDGLQEPRDVDPGHNVLSAIKNCFEDTTPSTTHKSLKSSLRKSIVHLSSPQSTLSKSAEQVTFVLLYLEDLQRPQNAIDINNLLLPESGQTSKYSENSKKGNSEKNIHGNEGELFNTEQVIQTVNTPSVVRNLAKSFNETYIIDQSAVQQPFSPTLKLLPKKRLSFKFPKEPEISNIKKIKMSEKGDQKQSGVLNRTIDTKKDSVSSFTKKTAVNENSFLKAVQPVMTPVEQNIEDDEDEFMIAEVDSFALNSWISNPKKAESKQSTSVHYKKSEVVSEKPIAVKRSISVTNSLVHQDISSQKFPAECEKQTNFQKTLNKQFSPNKQQAKGSLAKRKGNLTYLSSPTETNSSNENPKQRTLFQKNADNQLGSVPIKQLELREGIHMIKVVSTPKSGHIPEILTGEAEKNLTPEVPNALDPLSPMFPSAFKNSPTVKSMHSFGSEQIDLETEMLENGSETESFTTLQHMKRSKKVNNILGSTTTPKNRDIILTSSSLHRLFQFPHSLHCGCCVLFVFLSSRSGDYFGNGSQ